MPQPQGERTSLLLPLNLTAPGAFGITEELSMAGEDSRWLFEAQNAVFTDEGLLAPRKMFRQWRAGFNVPGIATNPFFTTASGNGYYIVMGDKIYTLSGNDIFDYNFLLEDGLVASTRPTALKHWKSVYMRSPDPAKSGWYLFADAEIPKFTDGSFFTMDMPDGPKHSIAHVAFGRIWTSNGTILQWSQLLNGRDWTTAGTGDLDLTAYLNKDEVATAIADFNNFLVVFTNRSVLIFQNPFNVGVDAAGAIADTSVMSLKEKIDNTGCVGVNAVANVGEELFFVSYAGLYRLSRVLSDGGSNPMSAVCPQVNRKLVNAFKPTAYISQNRYNVRLNYHPIYGCLSLEAENDLLGTLMIWLTRPIGNNSYAVTQWGNLVKTNLIGEDTIPSLKATKIFGLYSGIGVSGISKGIVAIIRQTSESGAVIGYAGSAVYDPPNPDIADQPVAETEGFYFRMTSSWLNFGDNPAGPVEKIPKDLKLIYRRPRKPAFSAGDPKWAGYTPTDLPVKFVLRYDYDDTTRRVHAFIAPYEDNYDPSSYKSLYPSDMKTTPVPLSGAGNLVQWELSANINNLAHETFAVQRAGFQTKLGRINQGI
jgi:hypothetical protein